MIEIQKVHHIQSKLSKTLRTIIKILVMRDLWPSFPSLPTKFINLLQIKRSSRENSKKKKLLSNLAAANFSKYFFSNCQSFEIPNGTVGCEDWNKGIICSRDNFLNDDVNECLSTKVSLFKMNILNSHVCTWGWSLYLVAWSSQSRYLRT